jgi:hypothetical protein
MITAGIPILRGRAGGWPVRAVTMSAGFHAKAEALIARASKDALPSVAMLMVIFGAGASYDSAVYAGGPDGRPPLAKELFDERGLFIDIAWRYPACRPLVDDLRQSQRPENPQLIESRLRELRELASADPELRRQLMAIRFYLRDVVAEHTAAWVRPLGGITNYVALLRQIGRWRAANGERVILVTFNYDEMLDHALYGQLGAPREDADETVDRLVSRNDWKLCKLHGSSNWVRRVHHGGYGHDDDPRDIALQLDFSGTREAIRNEWTIAIAEHLDEREGTITIGVPGKGDPRGFVSFPALAVPTEGKATFETPDSHRAAFMAALPGVSHLLIIGWRAAEEHALDDLIDVRTRYRLGIVSGDARGLQETLRNLGPVAAKAHPEKYLFDAGFSAFVRTRGPTDFASLPE